MTKEEVLQKIKEILAKDTRFKDAILDIKIQDKNKFQKPYKTQDTIIND